MSWAWGQEDPGHRLERGPWPQQRARSLRTQTPGEEGKGQGVGRDWCDPENQRAAGSHEDPTRALEREALPGKLSTREEALPYRPRNPGQTGRGDMNPWLSSAHLESSPPPPPPPPKAAFLRPSRSRAKPPPTVTTPPTPPPPTHTHTSPRGRVAGCQRSAPTPSPRAQQVQSTQLRISQPSQHQFLANGV